MTFTDKNNFDDYTSPERRYDNMLNLPAPKALRPMSAQNRAAQFSPFAALTGYDDKVKETARLTDNEIILTDSAALAIDYKLQILNKSAGDEEISVSYYVPDYETHSGTKKTGGQYCTHSGYIKKIDIANDKLIFTDSTEILIPRITDIQGNIFSAYEDDYI